MAVKDFHHPFQPYDIQQQFMTALYECIEQRQVGIFESPTGTGKSLSLICGALTWLREHKRKVFDDAMVAVQTDDDEPEWITKHAKESKAAEMRHMRNDYEKRLMELRAREQTLKESAAKRDQVSKRTRPTPSESAVRAGHSDDEFLLDDYDSQEENRSDEDHKYNTKTMELLQRLGMVHKSDQNQGDGVVEETKVIFCSRTHSQLSQFIGELQRVRLPPGLPPDKDVVRSSQEATEHLKHLTLGSRKNLCVNPKVNSLASPTAINEKCVELQQRKTSTQCKCAYMPNADSEAAVLDFRDHALASIRDIEDLAGLGSRLRICPYYAARSAVSPAEIVTLPYPLLLQKSAREALGISLKNHVVIIDEAHNLINAVESTYSCELSDRHLMLAKAGLLTYLQKFRNKLKGSNRTYITQVFRIVESLLQFIEQARSSGKTGDVTTSSALLAGKGVDQINLTKLVSFMTESKLARKVEGYLTHTAEKSKASDDARRKVDQPSPAVVDMPVLTHVQSFLLTLMNPAKEGHFIWLKDQNELRVQYLLLDPSEHFRDIVTEARAVILAGGTMSPMDDYRQQLFPYLPRLTTFSCGHLIPTSSLFTRALTQDVSGRMDFTFKSRTTDTALRLGKALLQISKAVHGGLVVFLPSYSYLEDILKTWKQHLTLDELQKTKPLFLDSRNTSAEDTFRSYSDAIHTDSHQGATLLSVIGGKLSEGINFSDDLGRCVIVVGLPFPNLDTPGWKAKMQHLETKSTARGEPPGRASREHAENVCMRSVNQAIGRVIRHKNDWASIILFDARYADARIQGKLPGWIKESFDTRSSGKVEDVVAGLKTFFTNKSAM